MLLLERLFALENETLLRKQEKQPPERESVQLVKNLEEKQQEDLGDANLSYFFNLHLIRTVNEIERIPLGTQSMYKNETNSEGFHKLFKTLK